MIDWQTVKEFFGYGAKVKQPLTEGGTMSPIKKQGVRHRPNRPAPPPIQFLPVHKRATINARNYYRRNGRYYSNDDDSLIEDTMLLLTLADLYGAGEIFEQSEAVVEEVPTEDLLDIDVSETPVMVGEEVSTTSVYDPKPAQQDYSSGYSDSDSSSNSGSDSSSCDSCDSYD